MRRLGEGCSGDAGAAARPGLCSAVRVQLISREEARQCGLAETEAGFVPFSAALCSGLAGRRVDELVILGGGGRTGNLAALYSASAAEAAAGGASAAAAAADAAATALGAALASPEHGPRTIRSISADTGPSPVLPHLCRALSAASRLRRLQLSRDSAHGPEGSPTVGAAAAGELAAALAPGRWRLEAPTSTLAPGALALALPATSSILWLAEFGSADPLPLLPRRAAEIPTHHPASQGLPSHLRRPGAQHNAHTAINVRVPPLLRRTQRPSGKPLLLGSHGPAPPRGKGRGARRRCNPRRSPPPQLHPAPAHASRRNVVTSATPRASRSSSAPPPTPLPRRPGRSPLSLSSTTLTRPQVPGGQGQGWLRWRAPPRKPRSRPHLAGPHAMPSRGDRCGARALRARSRGVGGSAKGAACQRICRCCVAPLSIMFLRSPRAQGPRPLPRR